MKIGRILFCFLLAALVAKTGSSQSCISTEQLKQAERGYGMFIHFGINTFNETEWSNGKLPVASYNPDQLDPDQWVRTAKEAGFKYVILVSKHHDGFCLWNSKYTDYDVAAAPIKTDVVAGVSKACKKYGLAFGIYYSLWDCRESTYNDKDSWKYVNYIKNQLTELLTQYGSICELWFDGGWAKPEADWHLPEIYAHIKKIQPNCQVTTNHTIQPPGQPHGIRHPKDMQHGDIIRFFPSDFRTKDPNLARWDDPKVFRKNDKDYYMLFEHTLCLSERWNWFQKKAVIPARSVDELEELFYWCTANNNIMILNVPPDQHGQIREHERLRILELADRLGIRNGGKPLPAGYENLAFNTSIAASSTANEDKFSADKANDYSLETWWIAGDSVAELEMQLPEHLPFNRLSIFEYSENKALSDGFSTIRTYHIKEYEIEIFNKNKWETIYVGDQVGACKIIQLPEYKTASAIKLKITKAQGKPGICLFAVSNTQSKK
ncbi:alpha-L-fucosidase [Niabella ginsengisoli]|uniref:alpha-L-fucosidase n=1 Tax=Niabella ginsengisoli TaxID=522298 RepID=A0ABS9SI65_9BACT|nr:alpha-L-fucosidase [Niabella ginsengisoli]MCH5598049.1 alpha-L-fucosidase [Niabella ginsengisoli]